NVKVAFVHDWLDTYRGGEKVLEAMLALYPEAPIFTLFYDPQDLPATITDRDVHAPRWLRKLEKMRQSMLTVLPRAIESFDLSAFDLVISSSSCVAKGAVPALSAKHICYLHSPMRYIWDQMEHYIRGPLQLPLINRLVQWEAQRLRKWDVHSANRV